ncbi:MAG: hypothetical protein IPK82_39175 [Polyangiaceae bacterium]|nr:hypothetical protein [Polyangiaceae bacterium]
MVLGPTFRFARLRFFAPLAALLLTACPPPPPPPTPKVEPPPVQIAEVAPPPLAAARWTESKGSTLVGPETAEGTLLLVGGRRMLVAKDGTAKSETVPMPERLIGLSEVVTSSGARKVIAFSEHGVFRLDDLLGEPKTLARSESEIWKVGSGPGVVAVWDFDSDVARFIDVESGQPKTLSNMPAIPPNHIVFKNAKEGAAVFEAAGLALTTDGGATWKPAGETLKGDALRVMDLKLRGDSVIASLGYGRSEVPIDFAGGKLGTPVEPQVSSSEAPLVKWVRRTERDPLSEVAQSGILTPTGDALVAASGLLARVDLKSGLVTELVEVSGDEARVCALVRAGDTGWLGCSLPDSEAGENMYDAFGVYKVNLIGKLAPERPVLKRSGDAELRASPSGGVMLLGSCDPENAADDLCVRQPDGKWESIRPSIDPWERGVGPLSDGRIVYIRGLYEGEDPPEDVAPAAPASREDGEGEPLPQDGRKAWVVAMDARGKENTLATISLPATAPEVSVRGFVQEDNDRRLHVVLFAPEEGPALVIAAPGKTPVEPQKVSGANTVKLAGNFGVAAGDGKLLTSTDGGATWGEVLAPRRIVDLIGGGNNNGEDGEGDYYDSYYSDDLFTVSDAGIRVEQYIRIGWGAQDALPEEQKLTGGVLLPRRSQPPSPGGDRAAVCTTDGAAQSTPPLNGTYQLQDLFVKGTPAKGTKRRVSSAPGGRYGMLDAVGVMVVEGSDKPGSSPSKWIFHWMDPTEVGSKPRNVSATAPKDAAWDPNLRSIAASGGRALFSMRSGSKNYVVRTKGAGIETSEVTYDLMPSLEVMFGSDKGEPIVWMAGNQLVVWLTGESPRVIATISGRSVRQLGQPTKDGVPMLLTSTSWSLAKVVSIPPLDKKDKTAKPVAHGQNIWLDGWTPIANYRRDLGKWAACGKSPKGFRVIASRYSGSANVDGAEESMQMAAYDLRVNGNEVCTANIIEFLSPLGRSTPKPGATPPKPGAPVPGPVAFLRYDLVGGKAEGGERGLVKEPPKGQPKPAPMVRKLTCKFEEKK